ncbi:MAG: ABC transporter permease [Bacillota bacterium]
MKAVFKREFMSYFNSMTGYVFSAFLICAVAVYFMAMNIFNGYPNFSYALCNSLFVLMIGIPVLTMRSMAEEKHNKTDQILLTAPIGVWQIIGGKYLAMLAVFAVPIIVFCLFPLIIKLNGTAYLLSDYLSIFTFFLLGAVYIAIGLFISSLTDSQIISVVITFLILLGLNLWNNLVAFMPDSSLGSFFGFMAIILLLSISIYAITKNKFLSSATGCSLTCIEIILFVFLHDKFAGLLPALLNYFTPTDCFYNVALYSALDVKGLLLYISLIGLFLFMTLQSVEKRRWS